MATPIAVRKMTGFVLDRVQRGLHHGSIKPLKGKDFAGVYEIRVDHDRDTYRTVYALDLGDAIYVLDVFQEKSKKGIATPKAHLDRIRARLKRARELAKEEDRA